MQNIKLWATGKKLKLNVTKTLGDWFGGISFYAPGPNAWNVWPKLTCENFFLKPAAPQGCPCYT